MRKHLILNQRSLQGSVDSIAQILSENELNDDQNQDLITYEDLDGDAALLELAARIDSGIRRIQK